MSLSDFAMCRPTVFLTCPMCERTYLWSYCSKTARLQEAMRMAMIPRFREPSMAVLEQKSRTIEITYAKTSACAGRFRLWHRDFGIHHHGAAAGSGAQLPR